MWDIGFMAWRIGDILRFDEQVAWVRDAGFRGFSFHASPGVPGRWQGVDPATADRAQRRRLRARLAAFSTVEVHAPFELRWTLGDPLAAVERLAPIVAFAGDVGASLVTVHPQAPGEVRADRSAACQEALARLDAIAAQAGVRVGVETLADFTDFRRLPGAGLENLGITLDVGHMYLNGGAPYRPYATIGGLVRALGDRVVHMHVHDYDGTHDHLKLGTGLVDLDDLLRAATEVHYSGAFCLELDPDRVSPDGILRSRDLLQRKIRRLSQDVVPIA
jgi:sugar phosphate isomerase/epimerase